MVSALERRRLACERSGALDAAEGIAWVAAESEEESRLRSDLASSVIGLGRIESALRVVALRARKHRGIHARADHGDPVDLLAAELALREEAVAEADRSAT